MSNIQVSISLEEFQHLVQGGTLEYEFKANRFLVNIPVFEVHISLQDIGIAAMQQAMMNAVDNKVNKVLKIKEA
ncbi:hypothetical protein LCGC14_1348670 [marine sediment metagenome]|uniref:Uncharacterized protein n=1 Tax=marine sediment metagenome TaxID=412755 RepID=A0A0F9MSD5_9ZZZZ